MVKKFHVTFEYVNGKTACYELAPGRGLAGIKEQIKKFRWYEVSSTEIVNLDNVLSVKIEDVE
jgi:hypothetical protein